ncbi:LOW QUALITY PROTEIN: phosphatidate phosphatase LPIN1 [Electrophorus electricus]|uniref:LOW QUALITY PROTEIN: phosphatidate phosphatase LPIN1 n=1 Tax=Electrophorus electricus TaxID=8005 RepID=UPI0015CF9A7A|nr:LOW QUALITY PROTEIN: phosphatidate phosphatase LPIN1 [Electrophorus electricus]
MNYVGQLAGQVFVQVKELYRGLNPATLSGCIDVIVVRRPDGSLHCSPFHVRFGKLGVLRSREKLVDIEVNGEPISLHMKLGDDGEAFFVEETENDQEAVPSHLATSPIVSDAETSGVTAASVAKRRRKKRRKSRVDSTKRETSAESSGEDDDVFGKGTSASGGDQHGRTSSREGVSASCSSGSHKQNGVCAHSDGDWTPTQSPNVSRPCSPNSDSELVAAACAGLRRDAAMIWVWGELPQPSFLPSKTEPPSRGPLPVPVSDSTHFRVIHEPHHGDNRVPPQLFGLAATAAKGAGAGHTRGEAEPTRTGSGRPGTPNGPMGQDAGTGPTLAQVEEGWPATAGPQTKADSPTKRKDRRSRHLGADGVYLDDITELEPEVAALYFPKSESNGTGRARCENASPPSVGGSGADSGSEQPAELSPVALSLCGGLADSREISEEDFQEKAVAYQQFSAHPALIDDPNLVVKIGSKYYNWSTAAPVLLAMQVFQKPLPKATVDSIVKVKMPRKGGRWWFSWRGRGTSIKPDAVAVVGASGGAEHAGKMAAIGRRKDEFSSSDEDRHSAKTATQLHPIRSHTHPRGVSYRKTLRLSSEQLADLQLKDGATDMIFSVNTQYQGTCRCEGTVLCWNWNDKIVISDIDGTITRSDTLGHILPTLGKDWTHQGITSLFHKRQNGYKFMYCSARAIGMANMTRGYLHWVNESGTELPQGPVLLSPSSLFSALHREVIEKKPETFKVECLNDIKNLFYPNTQPFYAAFGNRATDVYSYKEVGVPLNRIFTVNPKGELVQEHAKTNVSSYARLGEVVDHVFPLVKRSGSSDFPCSDTYSQFTFWREQLPLVDSQDCAGKTSS